MVAAHVERRWVVIRDVDRSVPVEAVAVIAVRRLWLDAGVLPGALVVANEASALGLGVDDVGVGGIDAHLEAVAGHHLVPVGGCDADAVARRRRAGPRHVVLHTAVDVVGIPHVDVDRVELPQRHLVEKVPGHAAVVAEVQATIVAEHQVVGVGRVDP